MAVDLRLSAPPLSLTIFSPNTRSPRHPSELRFSRWNNANAQPFIRKQRALQEIEDNIRRERRFNSASKIAQNPPNPTTTNENFKSTGTPSSPSRPSIPGKSSKYSKPPKKNSNSHPAFTQIAKPPKFPISSSPPSGSPGGVSIGEDGVSYRIPNAPFEFQYSYTETPKVKPLALREPPFVPFGPTTMARPWTGRAPLPPSKKKLPEFDSFRLPPPYKKGVKPVQAPGPFLAGMGPKYVTSREEIMGDPLTEDEIKDLIQGCLRSQRQLNIGRDGLTHNMLENIHAHWKRKRVCKIKCKGVCTVDMDNVCEQLEDKTGGKIIYSRGGVLFLYRGRNYNYRTRPRFPLMLWKPVTPLYPRLIKLPPEGLTLEESKEMRNKGRELPPICKLGKNGVYSNLVNHVREAFEECELVRINCEGMNGSDYRKIGGKLKDLVPCVLISFEREHILMWRGKDWRSSFRKPEDDSMKVSNRDGILVHPPNYDSHIEHQEMSDLFAQQTLNKDASPETPSYQNLEMPQAEIPCLRSEGESLEQTEDLLLSESKAQSSAATSVSTSAMNNETSSLSHNIPSPDESVVPVPTVEEPVTTLENLEKHVDESESTLAASEHFLGVVSSSGIIINSDKIQVSSGGSQCLNELSQSSLICMEGVISLRKQAIESGRAVVLDDLSLDPIIVYDKAVALAKDAPPGPVFKHGPKKVMVQTIRKQNKGGFQTVVEQRDGKLQSLVKQHNGDLEVREVGTVAERRIGKTISRSRILKDFKEVFTDTLPHGSLGVDELAKLLA